MRPNLIFLLLAFATWASHAAAQDDALVGQSTARAFFSDLVLPGSSQSETPQPKVGPAKPILIDSVEGNVEENSKESTGQGKPDEVITEVERGRIAFLDACTQCHEASRSLEQTKTFEQWQATIRKMAGKKDADIPVASFTAIARYLTVTASSAAAKSSMSDRDQQQPGNGDSNLDPSLVARGRSAFESGCLKCHDADRSTSKSKSYSDWVSTVRRMASKDGAQIPESDFAAIATYLASLSGSAGGKGNSTSEQGGGWSFGTTVSTLHRSASDESLVENPGFFADVWVTAGYQSGGAWSAAVTVCTSCHSTNSAISSYSLELLEGSATVDIRKLFTKCVNECGPQLSLKAGRFPVPFGAFSSMSHPGVYRTVTAPLMFNMGRRVFASGAAPPRQPVLPLPFSDEGFDFIFHQPLTQDVNLGVDIYAVNGLQGDESTMFESSRAYSDNNEEPSFGLRTTLGGQYLRFGGSLLHGGLQNQRRPVVDYTLWGVDATTQLTDRLRLYGEFARRRQDSTNLLGTAEKTFGVVGEAEFRFCSKPYLSMVIRYDTLEHESQSLGDAFIERLTSGFSIGMPRGSLLMINHEHWQPETGRDVDLFGVRWSVSL